MSESLNSKVVTATRWSAFAEIFAKLVLPISNIVLARLLTPEAFGVVTTLTMIITFAEIFTDAGFQKYLIQHDFKNEQDQIDSTNVAFWSNLGLSLILWAIIGIFSEPLASVVGNPGLGFVLIVACANIPLEAFSSIQMALYKRNLDFKTLFKVRIVSVMIPIVVTIPLAIILHSYWALVIGTLIQNVVNALLLTILSSWKPKLYYSLDKLKEMFSFTVWSMIEAISIWLTSYVDVFIVGTMLSQYYLGLYKTASTVVGQIMGLITAVTTPILFSSLSRLQSNHEEFTRFFLQFQKTVSMIAIPMGVGIYCYSNLVTSILLGNQWKEASNFIGLWGITSSITIVLGYFSSEVIRAKGLPKFSVLGQLISVIILFPSIYISAKYGFDALCKTRAIIRIIPIIFIIACIVARLPILKIIYNILPSCIASGVMFCSALLFQCISNTIFWQFCSILLCTLVYCIAISAFPTERRILLTFIHNKICIIQKRA